MIKIGNIKKNREASKQSGMSILEIMVVLGIYASLSAVVMFNYGKFQAKVDIVNLSNDIAQQVVQAQNSSLSGVMPPTLTPPIGWKPSYGVYFNSSATSDADAIPFNKKFIYFADISSPANSIYDGSTTCSGECIKKYTITKNNYISEIRIFPSNSTFTDLTITFARPDSSAIIYSGGAKLIGVSFVQITILSPSGLIPNAIIKLYPSGRVQIS